MSAEDFPAWAAHETIRHGFAQGEVSAMAGAEEGPVTAGLNIARALRTHLASVGLTVPAAALWAERPQPAADVATATARDAARRQSSPP